MKMSEIKNMNKQMINQKIEEIKKQIFDEKQKLIKGELKNFNLIKQLRKDVARLLTAIKIGGLPEQVIEKVKVAEKTEKKNEKKEIQKKAKVKKEKVVKEKSK